MIGLAIPGYHSRAYFGGSLAMPDPGAAPDLLPAVQGVITDAACFRSILGTLVGSGIFEQVVFGPPGSPASGGGAVCWVQPHRSAETVDSDVTVRMRTVRYRITAYCRVDSIDDTPASLILMDLAAELSDLIDRYPPPGCFASLCRVLDGGYPDSGSTSSATPRAVYPFAGVDLSAQFCYAVDSGQRSVGRFARS